MNSIKSAESLKKARTSLLANGVRASATSEPLRLAGVAFQSNTLVARFTNGSRISVDVRRYPRLWRATASQRKKWRLIGEGLGVHWPEIDEDLSIAGLMAGVDGRAS